MMIPPDFFNNNYLFAEKASLSCATAEKPIRLNNNNSNSLIFANI